MNLKLFFILVFFVIYFASCGDNRKNIDSNCPTSEQDPSSSSYSTDDIDSKSKPNVAEEVNGNNDSNFSIEDDPDFKSQNMPLKNKNPVHDKFSRCGYLNGLFECTKKQIHRINVIQKIIDDLKERSDDKDLDKSFTFFQNKKNNKNNLFLLGELHNSEKIVLDNYALIEKYMVNNALILLEGYDSSLDTDTKGCAIFIVSGIYGIKKYNKKNNSYNSSLLGRFRANAISDIYDVFYELDFSKLKINSSKCHSWDSLKGLKNNDMILRNNSLVSTSLEEIKRSQVFVVAGFLHSPVGQYYEYNKEKLVVNGPLNAKSVMGLDELDLFFRDPANSKNETINIYNSFYNESIIYVSHNDFIE